MDVIKNSKYLLITIVILISFMLCIANHQEGHNWGGDFALYLHQTESLVDGTMNDLAISSRYIIENTPVNFSPVLYPWGLPILLSPIYYFFGVDYSALKIWEAIFFMGALLIMFITFRKGGRLSFLFNALLVSTIAFNVLYIKHTNQVLSEIPFLCFSFLGLYSILKLLDSYVNEKDAWLQSIITGAILYFCFSIRTEGIGLFGALLVGQIQYMIKQRKTHVFFLFSIPYVTALALYIMLSKWLPSGFLHHLNFTHTVNWSALITKVSIYFNLLKTYMFDVPIIPFFIYIAIAFASFGVVIRIKKDLVFAVFLGSQIVAFLIWPSTNLRYLYTVYPLLLYFFVQGLYFCYKKWNNQSVIQIASVFILSLYLSTILVNTIVATVRSLSQGAIMMHGPEMDESKEMFAYIRKETREVDVIAFFKPRVMHFYTDRLSLALFPNIKEVTELANYYVESKKSGHYFQIPIENTPLANAPHFNKVFSNEEFNIYKVVK